ncbi:MAG: BON domain-containing protein, partial [Planctomycetota bacterium]
MKRGWTILSVGTGAGLMYLLDPERGRRRRALLRDKAAHGAREVRRALGLASRDLVNRSRGVVAEVRHKIESGDADDDVLIERVRARIGHVASHPHAIHVEAEDGHVTLTGPILADEVVPVVEACE